MYLSICIRVLYWTKLFCSFLIKLAIELFFPKQKIEFATEALMSIKILKLY